MKKLFLIVCIGLITLEESTAQLLNLNWVTPFVPTVANVTQGYCVTYTGTHVISAGIFNGTVDFNAGPGVNTLTSTGSSDMYICDEQATGIYSWAIQIVGTGAGFATPRRIISNGSFIFVTGYFNGSCDFNGSALGGGLTSSGVDDIFLAKYDMTGALIWVYRMGALGPDRGYGIDFDQNGDIIVCGAFSSTVDFNPAGTPSTITSSDLTDGFFCIYDDVTGAMITVSSPKRIGGPGTDAIISTHTSPSGNLHMCGYFSSITCDFDPAGPTVNPGSHAGLMDAFVAQYTPTGTYSWAIGYGAPSNDQVLDIVADPLNRIFATGTIASDGVPTTSTSFATAGVPINLTPVAGSPSGMTDVTLIGINPSGSIGWAQSYGTTGNDVGMAVNLDDPTHIYIAGYFSGASIDFDYTGAVANPTTYGGLLDIFMTRYDIFGNYKEVASTGSTGNDRLRDMSINKNNNIIYTTGGFANTVDFDPDGGVTNKTATGTENAYVASYDYTLVPLIVMPETEEITDPEEPNNEMGNQNTLTTETSEQNKFKVYPNPTTGALYLENITENNIIEIYTVDGRLVGNWVATYTGSMNLMLENLIPGIYQLIVKTKEDTLYIEKLIKQ